MAEGRLRVSARLVDARSGHQLWSERYDREVEDVLALQEEIARAIVNALGVRLLGDASRRLVTRYTENVEAYQAYLRGRALFARRYRGDHERILLESIESFERALELDPGLALAWSGIADSYAYLADTNWPPHRAYSRAADAADRAVELDPSLGEAWISRAFVKFLYGWDRTGALEDLARGVELAPRYARGYWLEGFILHSLGRYEEARRSLGRAVALDPSPYFRNWYEPPHFRIRPPPAILRRTLDSLRSEAARASADARTQANLRMAEYLAGNHRRFLDLLAEADPEALERLSQLGGRSRDPTADPASGPNYRNAAITVSLARVGRKEEARAILSAWEALAEERYVPPHYLAVVETNLGRIDAAFRRVDQAL